MKHPNATVAGGSTGAGALIVLILSKLHITLTAYEGLLIAGGIGTIILFIGRNGISGVWHTVWRGNKPAVPPAAPPG